MKRKNNFLLLLCLACFLINCTKTSLGSTTPAPVAPVNPTPPFIGTNDINFWLTTNDQSVLLQKQTGILSFGNIVNANPVIEVDTTQIMQSIDGFGFTLTGGSAGLINNLPGTNKVNLLQELFGTGSGSIGISFLRISIGASDLSATTFTYNDQVPGQPVDTSLKNFNLNAGDADLIPLLKQIIAINPTIKILGSPWSAPTWMKDNNSFTGGSLLPKYYALYAQYFVKFINQMKANGITIDAITPQNEPLNSNNTPSMVVTALQEAEFIKTNLGPAFVAAGLTTKIIVWDHNCDVSQYPITILNDAAAYPFVNGSAFHLYAGQISALSNVHDAFPQKQVYFTEQYTPSNGNFGGDLKWHVKNVIIGSMRNWSRNALEWNLANNGNFGPHTNGGCTTCKGALTIGTSVDRNVGYYIIAHASKFVPAGSQRIASNISGDLQSVAFKTPDGKKVLIVENDGDVSGDFNIKFNGKWVAAILPAGAVGTFVW